MNNKYIGNTILIKLLKLYKIKKLVLSSGARNVPFVFNVENDSDFECFSVIDERNAAFFALGLSQQSNEPVAIACTSGTAASNYITGITEAYYSHVPIVVLTFDRNPYMYNQLETQKIDQESIFDSITKKNVTLPVVKDEEDIWYCNRIINEALMEIYKPGCGPVHINIPLVGNMNNLFNGSVEENIINAIKKIDYISYNESEKWEKAANVLLKKEKILLIIGQENTLSENQIGAIKKFAEITKCPILTDNLSNFKSQNNILAGPIIKALNRQTIDELLPEIIISFGNNMQERIKELLREKNVEHWYISEDGELRDCFKSLSILFETTIDFFFEKINNALNGKYNANGKYFDKWANLSKKIKMPEMPFSNFYVTREFSNLIPDNSLLHLAILNATRQMQFFPVNETIKVYSNVNAFGIDGCLPTFMGQAYATENLAFLIIGDLSFFYGMNALAIKHIKNNIRILMINNGGGAEFHIQPDSNNIPTIDKHIGAAHNRRAEAWAKSLGYKYISANNKEEFNTKIKDFVKKDYDSPVFFEVFTNMKLDGEFCLSVYREMEKSISPFLENRK